MCVCRAWLRSSHTEECSQAPVSRETLWFVRMVVRRTDTCPWLVPFLSTVLAESTGDNSPASPLWMPLSVRFSEKNFWNFEMHKLEGKRKQKIQRLIINQFLANRNSYERRGRQILYVLTCYVSQELEKEGRHSQPYISAPDRTLRAM